MHPLARIIFGVKRLDISIENAKVRLHRARKKLKAILNDKCLFERNERAVLICLPKTVA